MDTTDKIFLHQIAVPGQPGNITEAEAAAIRADQAAILARPVIEALGDVPDVDLTGLGADEVLTYNDVTGAWEPRPPATGMDVYRTHTAEMLGADGLNFSLAFTAEPSASVPGTAYIGVNFGTTPGTVAAGPHPHEVWTDTTYQIDASGSLSSGTRPLVSETLTGLDPGRTYVITGELRGDVRGEGSGAGRSHPSITIHGNLQTRFRGPRGYVRSVAGVDREYGMTHSGVSVSGVTSVAVAAAIAHIDGDPKYIGAGQLVLTIRPNR